jgi:signal transduction histidine kinase
MKTPPRENKRLNERLLMPEKHLSQTQKLEMIGTLAYGIAHDLNNILTTISGYSEMLQDDLPKSSPSARKVAGILMAVSKARLLTSQIFAFGRQAEQEKISVNVYEVLKETIAFMRSEVPPGISLKRNIRVKDALVSADPTQLFRVFLNLITNAVQSMEERKGTISVSMMRVEAKKIPKALKKALIADEYVMLTFKDQGKGMDPSVLRRIFDPFYTTREAGKGAGLGLSVVHGIVSEIGGEVHVSSKKEIGSVFRVYLPTRRENIKKDI